MNLSPRPVTLDCYILDTGYCLASEHHLLQGAPRRQMECHSLAALLRHPEQGWLLWDTGYAPRMLTVTRRWPYWLYRLVTPLHIRPEQAAIAQLARQGIAATQVKTILISHFHADHIAGLSDFPAARFVAAGAGYNHIAGRSGFSALQRAFIPALLPSDFAGRAELLDAFDGPSLPGLGQTHDLYGDGSLLLFQLPGHARGQLGLLANTSRGRLLFAADAAWMSAGIRQQKPPARLTNLIIDDPAQMLSSLGRLHSFWQARPEVRLLPTHCPEAYAWGRQAALPPAQTAEG